MIFPVVSSYLFEKHVITTRTNRYIEWVLDFSMWYGFQHNRLIRKWMAKRVIRCMAGVDEPLTVSNYYLPILMLGLDAFCPKSGAPLSDERHYEEQGSRKQAVLSGDQIKGTPPTGELTNGAIRSSKMALLNYFQRCHQRHYRPNDDLYQKASLAFTRLKRAATGKQTWDVHVWYAAQKRLRSAGYETSWMDSHSIPRCSHCHGRLKYVQIVPGSVIGRCGTNCTDRRIDHLEEIRNIIAVLYKQAFRVDDNTVSADSFLRF